MSWNIPFIPFVILLLSQVLTLGAGVLIIWLLIQNARRKRAEQHEERMAMIARGLVTPRTAGSVSGGMEAAV